MSVGCDVAGCSRPCAYRSWCTTHYARWYKTGRADGPTQFGSLAERLMRRVIKQSSGCWEWQGARSHLGHGVIGRGRRDEKLTLTHRASWEVHVGPIPDGLCVLHRCDNPPCVNPDHLWLGTRDDNNKDMAAKGRHAAHVGTLNPQIGSAHHAAKINEETAAAIKRSVGTHAAVAARFGTTRTIVAAVRAGRTWRHV